MHIPKEISQEEWKQILALQKVQLNLEVIPNESLEQTLANCYGVKFDFTGTTVTPTAPCYIYIIQGSKMSIPPIVLAKYDGFLPVDHVKEID